MGPGCCPACGRQVDELHYSTAVGGACCLPCHCRAAPPASPAARRYRPPKPPHPPKPDRYARFVQHLQDRLDRLGLLPFSFGDGRHIAAYCPVCLDGTMLITLAEIRGEPAARYSSAGTDGCSLGCSSDLIVSVIG